MYIDVTRLIVRGLKGRLPTGVDRVGLAYIAQFGPHAAAAMRLGSRMVALTPLASQRLFSTLLATPSAPLAILRALIAALPGVRSSKCMRGALLLNTGHSGLERVGYGASLQRIQAKPVFLLHDLIPITHPEYCREGEAARHARRIETMLSCGAAVVANSQSTLDELGRYAAGRKTILPRAVAAPLAPALLPPSAQNAPLTVPYFVVLGTIEGRKNLVMLLQIWRSLHERMGELTPRLVVIGQRGWECENVLDLLERSEPVRQSVIELGRCSDQELATWLGHARALLFPSFAEGYGLPLMEALAAGVPVIASDLPVFREIAGAVPEYLDPLDGLGWRNMVQEYASPGSTRRSAQCLRLAGFRSPTWAQHFERVGMLVEELA
jgi:glycosyltransferase involved in cell wall biosynthesis